MLVEVEVGLQSPFEESLHCLDRQRKNISAYSYRFTTETVNIADEVAMKYKCRVGAHSGVHKVMGQLLV